MHGSSKASRTPCSTKKMKILLINPPILHKKWSMTGVINPPLGIMYLSSAAKRRGHEVKILDALGEAPKKITAYNKFEYSGMRFSEIVKQCRGFDIVGITNLFSYSFPIVSALSSEIKKKFDIPIVAGGAHASALPDYSLRHSEIDYVFLGEAEESFIELVEAIEQNKTIEAIRGVGYKKDGRVIINGGLRFVEDLDSLPFPDREGINLEIYSTEKEGHGPVKGRWTSILSSRGCPYKCTYCTSPNFNNRYRSRTPENFVAEIEECVNKYGINEFLIEDENFTLEKKRVIKICKLLLKKGIHIKWQLPNGIRSCVTDMEVLRFMKQTGCTYLCIAPESGSPRIVQDVMKKNLDLRRVLQFAGDCTRLGIKTGAFFIIGFPDEKKEDIKMTLRYALKLARIGVDDIIVSNLGLLPGSELFNDFEKEKKISLNEDFFASLITVSDISSTVSWSEHLSGKYIRYARNKIVVLFHLVRFIFHPLKTMKSIFNILTLTQDTKTEKELISLIRGALKI